MKRNLAAAFAFAFMGLGGNASAEINQGHSTIERLDEICAGIQTHRQAEACLAPLHREAMLMAEKVWATVHAQTKPDPDKMAPNQRRVYLTDMFSDRCIGKAEKPFREGDSPEAYLRKPLVCLSFATDLADKFGADYNKEDAAYLISRTRRLRRLDL